MYNAPEMEVTLLEAEDILTSSIDDDIWEEGGKDEDSTPDDEL